MRKSIGIFLLVIITMSCWGCGGSPSRSSLQGSADANKPSIDWVYDVQIVDLSNGDEYIKQIRQKGWHLVSYELISELPQKYVVTIRREVEWTYKAQIMDLGDVGRYIRQMRQNGWQLVSSEPIVESLVMYTVTMRREKGKFLPEAEPEGKQ